MSILDKNIPVPLPTVADWWEVRLRFNAPIVAPFTPEGIESHVSASEWPEYIRRKISNTPCRHDTAAFVFICKSIIGSELINVADIKIGWPRIGDDTTCYSIMGSTSCGDLMDLGTLIIKPKLK